MSEQVDPWSPGERPSNEELALIVRIAKSEDEVLRALTRHIQTVLPIYLEIYQQNAPVAPDQYLPCRQPVIRKVLEMHGLVGCEVTYRWKSHFVHFPATGIDEKTEYETECEIGGQLQRLLKFFFGTVIQTRGDRCSLTIAGAQGRYTLFGGDFCRLVPHKEFDLWGLKPEKIIR